MHFLHYYDKFLHNINNDRFFLRITTDVWYFKINHDEKQLKKQDDIKNKSLMLHLAYKNQNLSKFVSPFIQSFSFLELRNSLISKVKESKYLCLNNLRSFYQ